ncbi:hypothetical protein ACWEKM_31685 [Streptomyces sp. NPDC004752]
MKFLDLVAASVILSTTIDMTRTLRQMAREGWTVRASDPAVLIGRGHVCRRYSRWACRVTRPCAHCCASRCPPGGYPA